MIEIRMDLSNKSIYFTGKIIKIFRAHARITNINSAKRKERQTSPEKTKIKNFLKDEFCTEVFGKIIEMKAEITKHCL